METTRLIIFIIACVCVLFGYFRLLSDEQGHVDLNNYRFTGGLGKVLYGVFEGSRDLLAAEVSSESVSACAIYAGIILFIVAFNL